MKSICLMMGMLLANVVAFAQKSDMVNMQVEARGDYQRDYQDSKARKDECGFKGKYLNVKVSGALSDQFSYAWRQRMNKMTKNSSFFDATDWLYLSYNPIKNMSISAGKQVVAIGGYEYDRAPIDLYFCSEFWNNVPCYAWGVGVAWQNSKDKWLFQVCESPFCGFYEHKDMYAYNLMWYGEHGWWSTMWSANMMEWDEGRYIGYIAQGNKFQLSNNVCLELDWMNRASSGQTFFFRNCSLIGELSYRPIPQLNTFVKVSYDVNQMEVPSDLLVRPGTELTRVGAGVEVFPLSDNRVRLHANYCYSFGTNTNPEGVMLDRQMVFDVGLTWHFELLSYHQNKSEK